MIRSIVSHFSPNTSLEQSADSVVENLADILGGQEQSDC